MCATDQNTQLIQFMSDYAQHNTRGGYSLVILAGEMDVHVSSIPTGEEVLTDPPVYSGDRVHYRR